MTQKAKLDKWAKLVCVRFSHVQIRKVISAIRFCLTGNVQLALWLHSDERLHVVSVKGADSHFSESQGLFTPPVRQSRPFEVRYIHRITIKPERNGFIGIIKTISSKYLQTLHYSFISMAQDCCEMFLKH